MITILKNSKCIRPQYFSLVLIKSITAKSFGYERRFWVCKPCIEKYHTGLAILISTKSKIQGREKHKKNASEKQWTRNLNISFSLDE